MKRLYIFIILGLLSAVLATAVIASAMNSKGLSASEMVESLKKALVPGEEEAKEEEVPQAKQEAALENLAPSRASETPVRQVAPRSWNFGLTQVSLNEDELRSGDDALLDIFSLPGQLAEFGQLSVPDIQSLGENVVSFDNLRVAYSVPQRSNGVGFDGDPGGPSNNSGALGAPIISGGKELAVADDQDSGTGTGTGDGTGDGVTGDTGDTGDQNGQKGNDDQGQEDPLGSPENPIPNPEPGTLALTAIGAGMALLVARRRSR